MVGGEIFLELAIVPSTPSRSLTASGIMRLHADIARILNSGIQREQLYGEKEYEVLPPIPE